MKHKGEMSFH